MARKRYPSELKAQVVAAWKSGSSLNAIVKAHALPKTTVQRWVAGVQRVSVPVPEQKKDPLEAYDLDAMAWRLVGGSFDALAAVHGLTEDKDWLRRQNAADVAVFYGVISDKLVRLLEASQRRSEGDAGDAAES